MNYLEIVGTAIGIIYLYLEYHANVWLWVANIAMPAVYLIVYYDAGLYADFGINIYYLIASVYGLFCWLKRKGKDEEGESANSGITHTPVSLYIWLLIITAVLFVVIGFILKDFTDSTVPWADSFTTALSITAMWMLARKYVEQWLVWIVVDMVSCALYIYKDLWFTGGLYAVYAIISVLGYRKWRSLIILNPNGHNN